MQDKSNKTKELEHFFVISDKGNRKYHRPLLRDTLADGLYSEIDSMRAQGFLGPNDIHELLDECNKKNDQYVKDLESLKD